MLRRSRLALAAAALSVSTYALVAHAGLVGIDKAHVKIEGRAKGLGKFDGKCTDISAKEDGGKIVFTADLHNGLDMGVRDSHTRKEFKVNKGSVAKLIVDKGALTMPNDGKEVKDIVVPGTLKLAGGETKVDVTYTASRTGSDYHIKSASFSFDYTKFGIKQICKTVICVEPKVTVSVRQMKLRNKG